MLMAIATGMRAMTRVLKTPMSFSSYRALKSALLPLACHAGGCCCQSPDAIDEPVEEDVGVDIDRDLGVRGVPGEAAPVRDGHRVGQATAGLDVDEHRPGPDERAVDRRGDGERIVDDRAVEAVVACVELEVEAQRIDDEG